MEDIVCGMDVSEDSKFKSVYNGKVYHFCSAQCKQKFDKEPGRYVKG
ncbi:MAG: YHS domain-containing protein [Candidatus Micrarchaeota archaeon]|nr:YHS domain-containing protein [Candidatus Micrarchaeota archaeon]